MSFAETPSPDEDKWKLRERMLEFVKPQEPYSDSSDETEAPSSSRQKRFETLFRPRHPAPVTRSIGYRLSAKLRSILRQPPKGVNDNQNLPASIWRQDFTETIKTFSKRSNHLAQKLSPYLLMQLRPRLRDISKIPPALVFFILPLMALTHFSASPSPTLTTVTLIGTCLLTNLVAGPRFGTLATLSAYTWLSIAIFPPSTDTHVYETLSHWIMLIFGGAVLGAISIGLGSLALITRNLFRLALKASSREGDIAEFQEKVKRAHHSDAILSYIVAYCRDKLDKRAIFLALEEGLSQADQNIAFDIGKQLKSTGFARVVVNRQTYLPRAIQSFTSSGFDAFRLETPSGVVALLGIDISDGKKLSALDRRYLRLLLISAAYALERIFLLEKISTLEEASIEGKARNAAIMSIVANLSQTTQNIDDQAYGLHQLLDHEINRPYDTAMQLIRRNISALRNSVALLRDVAS